MTIWVPPTARRTHLCRLCGTRLYESEYQQHVVKCSNRKEEEIHDLSLRTRLPGLYDEAAGDADYNRWVRTHPREWKRERGIPD